MKQAEKIDPKAQENTTRRIGLQSRLKEDVKEAVEDKGCLARAKANRFATTGEPKSAPTAK